MGFQGYKVGKSLDSRKMRGGNSDAICMVFLHAMLCGTVRSCCIPAFAMKTKEGHRKDSVLRTNSFFIYFCIKAALSQPVKKSGSLLKMGRFSVLSHIISKILKERNALFV